MLGLFRDGVGGIESVGSGPLPPVCSVKARLLGLRLGGVGGFTKEGDDGADDDGGGFCTGRAAVFAVRPRLREEEVLTAKFFRLRGFFAGVVGRWSSKNCPSEEPALALSLTVFLGRKSGENDEGDAFAAGEAGEGPGEGSVSEDPSIVEMVVVGDESVDSEAEVDVLPRC